MTKRIICGLLIMLMLSAFFGCKNGNDKSDSDTAVKMTPIPDDATGSTISMREQDGEEGDVRGDGEEMYPNADRIVSVITQFTAYNSADDTEAGSTRSFNPCDKDGFDEYVNKLKELGFTQNISSQGNKDKYTYYYLAKDSDGVFAEVRVNDTETVISVFSELSYIGK